MTGTNLATVTLADEAATLALGVAIAAEIEPGDVVILTGGLGAGKTTVVKGLVGALDGAIEVTSPTFALCHRYDCDPPVAHVDCWRIERAGELADLALDELLDDGWVAIIEWGERFDDVLGGRALHLELDATDGGRVATISSSDPRWARSVPTIAESARANGEPR